MDEFRWTADDESAAAQIEDVRKAQAAVEVKWGQRDGTSREAQQSVPRRRGTGSATRAVGRWRLSGWTRRRFRSMALTARQMPSPRTLPAAGRG